MASVAESRPQMAQASWKWARSFLKQELSPYPGRSWTVARMVISATLMMLWIMVFRVPGAALGAYYTLLFSRDSPQATVKSAVTAVSAVGCSLSLVLFSAVILVGNPLLHFLWVVGILFLIFFLISALGEYRAATAFGFMGVTSVIGWDFPANTELRVEGTLWTGLAIALAACVTVSVELMLQRIHPFDQLSQSLLARLETVEAALTAWGEGQKENEETASKLTQYAMTGTGTLRRLLIRSDAHTAMKAEWSGVVSLAGRLIDLSASAENMHLTLSPEDRKRCLAARDDLHTIRNEISDGHFETVANLQAHGEESDHPFLMHIERTIALIPQVFSGLAPLAEFLPSAVDFQTRTRFWKEDAFSNPDHLRFALKGTLAAVSCYVLYNAVAWPGLNTAVSTCMITALSTIGSSRQKQILRVAGALMGGLCLGMTAQAFLLPHMTNISQFTVLFMAVTAFAAWIGTSSPRLSFAGLQTAFAFYITQLRTFGPQTSLTVARDDVAGILLGLGAMWITFDQIWAEDSAAKVLRLFTANLRRIAGFQRNVDTKGLQASVDRVRAERGLINDQFDLIRNESDALFFEFGSGWEKKVHLRNEIRAWQPQLRIYFLLHISLTHYRLQETEKGASTEALRCLAESERLLQMLADWKDAQERDNHAQAPPALLARIDKLGREEQSSDSETSENFNSANIATSMLHVAVGLAQAMMTDSAEGSPRIVG